MDEQTPEQEPSLAPQGGEEQSAPSGSNGRRAEEAMGEQEPGESREVEEQAGASQADREDPEGAQAAPEDAEGLEAAGDKPAEQEDVEEQGSTPGAKRWYVLKVQSGREDSIRESLERRVAIEGLGEYFGKIVVPTEKVSEIKGGKRRVSDRKLYPGYIMIEMELNDPTWYMVRDTPGVGDFTGAAGQKPMPMLEHEVEKMLGRETAKEETQPRLKIDFRPGDTVKIKEGPFENFEGNVEGVDEANGRVTVVVNIFGRSCPVELEYWQVEGI